MSMDGMGAWPWSGESVQDSDSGPKDNDSVFLTTHVLKNYMKDERREEEYSSSMFSHNNDLHFNYKNRKSAT